MKNLIILIIVLIGAGMSVKAQEKSNKELRGDKHYILYSFDKAIDTYTHVKHLSVEGHRRLAESYHNMNQDIKSEEAYSELVNLPAGVLPEDHYNYSRILKINGKYTESDIAMDKFVALKPNDLRGKNYVANKGEFANILKDDGKYKIISQNVNTDAEDFAPSYYKDKLVFSSSRAKPKMIVRKNNWTGNPFYDLYVSEIENGQLRNPKVFDKGLNGKMHDGPASFSKDGNYMAFTSNHYDLNKSNKVVELGIHFSNYVDEKWSESQAFALNNNDYSVGHPCLTPDGKTMYFTCDKPGGYGGADIYRVTKGENGIWGNAENMGDKLNTEGDETFPFYEENSNTLLFSSNGLYGLGGLDVFICELEGSEANIVYNAGAPLNSQFDDYGVIVNENMTKGYFSSNRSNGSGSGDIYALIIDIQKEIKGIAKDKNNNLIAATFITLMDDKDNILDTLTTKDDASYSFLVDSDMNYKLNGTKEKFNDGNNTVNTFSEELIVFADVILLKKEEVIVEEVAPEKVEKVEDLPVALNFKPNTIYFDFGKYEIRPDAKADLDEIVKVMNANPAMVMELRSYTDCRASNGFNQTLSNNRAKAAADYIKKSITEPSRITSKGFGETNSLNDCICGGSVRTDCSEEEFQNDRRTEFIVVSNNKAIASSKPISQSK